MSCGSNTDVTETGDGTASNPFIVWRGRNWGLRLILRDQRTGSRRDLTGYTGESQVRLSTGESGPPAATATVSVVAPATQGRYEVTLDADDLSGVSEGRYVMDVRFTNDGDATDQLFAGFFHIMVLSEVTT